MGNQSYFLYMLASKERGTLYVGVTKDLERRMYEHKNKIFKGFTEKYDVNRLVYFEETQSIIGAITREKQVKKWKRSWKVRLIEEFNPTWYDFSRDWF